MKYLTANFFVASLLAMGAFSQSTINPSDPSWGWDDYQQLKCQDGYNKVSNYCVKCDTTSGKFFDPTTKQCRSCPTGTTYNSTTQTCECECEEPRSINPITNQCECPGNQVWLDNDCQCPEDLPLWNGKACVACPEGTTFEPKDKQCYHCPEGFVADPVTHHCKPGL